MKSLILIILYLIVGFTPYFGASDKQSVQIFYLQILNFLSILLISKDAFKGNFKNLKIDLSLFFYFLFFLISSLSLFIAENKVEGLRILTDVFTYLVSFFVMTMFFNDLDSRQRRIIINTIIIILGIEVFMVLLPFFRDFLIGEIKPRSTQYSGTTGNINIAAFSILMKLPILLYKLLKLKKIKFKFILLFILLFLSELSIISVSLTRGAILSLLFLNVIVAIFYFLQYTLKVISRNNLYRVLLILLISIGSNYAFNKIAYSKINVVERLQTLGSTEDDSIAQRKRYYTQSLHSIIENPLLGIGIGNWKLKGIEADLPNLRAYIVPYHSHNDFLEISAETGIFGGLIYYMFFLVPLFLAVVQVIRSKFNKESTLAFYLGSVIVIYFLDSMFNFPFARPIQNIFLLVVIVFLTNNILNTGTKKGFLINKKWAIFIFMPLIFISPISIYSSYRLYNSSKEQLRLLAEYNYNLFTTPIADINKLEMEYPNLSGTTIPLKTFKGVFYIKSNIDSLIDPAIKLFKEGNKINPYLPINDTYLSFAYLLKKKNDSALYFGEKAFKAQPNNLVHFTHYLFALNELNDTLKMKKIYDQYISFESKDKIASETYFNLIANRKRGKKSNYFIQEVREELYSQDEKMKVNLYLLEYGLEELQKADSLYLSGEEYFKNKDYINAAKDFEAALKINPKETPYFENAALSYLQLSNYEKVFKYSDTVISRKINTGKAYYIKGLAYLEMEKKQEACVEFKNAIKNKLYIPQGVINLACN